jgi:hypothetical protein
VLFRSKKAVRNVYALEKLALALGVSAELIQDIADGLVDMDDAWFEFEEGMELRRVHAAMTPDLRIVRHKRLQAYEKLANDLLERTRTHSIPVFLPELITLFPYVTVAPGDVTDRIARSVRGKPGLFQIRHRKGEMNAHTRAAIAREFARVLLFAEREKLGLPPRHELLDAAEIIAFSNALLVPKAALKDEIQKQRVRVDMVGSLAEAFWVPRSIVRSRVKEIVLENLTEAELVQDSLKVRPNDGSDRRPSYWPNNDASVGDLLSEEGAVSSENLG